MLDDHAQAIDGLVSVFEKEVSRIVAEARRETLRALQDRLAVTKGVIDRTQANARVLQSIRATFKRKMNTAGYQELVRTYVGSFNGQFAFFQEVLDDLGKQIGRNLTVTFGDRDKGMFLQQQGQTVAMLHDAVDVQARAAQQQAMYSVGAIKASDLSARIADKLDLTVGKASAIADTSLSTFYRTIADRGYQQVEKGLTKKLVARYRIMGPRDLLNRPFCKHITAGTAYTDAKRGVKVLASTRGDKTYTREELMKMSNGQLVNVVLTVGGFRCRHTPTMVIEELPNSRERKKARRGAK